MSSKIYKAIWIPQVGELGRVTFEFSEKVKEKIYLTKAPSNMVKNEDHGHSYFLSDIGVEAFIDCLKKERLPLVLKSSGNKTTDLEYKIEDSIIKNDKTLELLYMHNTKRLDKNIKKNEAKHIETLDVEFAEP